MDISVILSTYNATKWLEKVLWGYNNQIFKDFEIVIADDGSGPETKELIDAMAKRYFTLLNMFGRKMMDFKNLEFLTKLYWHVPQIILS